MVLTWCVYDKNHTDKKTKEDISMKKEKNTRHKTGNTYRRRRTIRGNLKEIQHAQWMGQLLLLVVTTLILVLIYFGIQSFGNEKLAITQEIEEVKYYNLTVQNTNFKIMMTRDETLIDSYRTDMNNTDMEIQKDLKDLKKKFPQSADRIANVQKLLQQALTYRSQAVLLASSNKIDEALDMAEDSYLPIMQDVGVELEEISSLAEAEQQQYFVQLRYQMVAFEVFSILLIIGVGYSVFRKVRRTTKDIDVSVTNLEHAMAEMALGNLEFEIHMPGERNEIDMLAQKLLDTCGTLKNYVMDVSQVLGAVAEKNCTVKIGVDYQGMFKPIRSSMEHIIHAVAGVVNEVKDSSGEIQVSSESLNEIAVQLSDSAQQQTKLAEGLYLQIDRVAGQTENNMQASEEMQQDAARSQEAVAEGNLYVENLNSMIDEVEQTFTQINSVFEMIQDIAEQIKLLTLNASIEAARAGAAGRGFAVLANQMRNLVEQTGEASVATGELIQAGNQKMHNSKTLVEQVQENFEQITAMGGKMAGHSQRLWQLSVAQKEALQQARTQADLVENMASGYCELAEVIQQQGQGLNVRIHSLTTDMEEFRIHC